MIDRQHPDDAYSPFVLAPRASSVSQASTPFAERDVRTESGEDEVWRAMSGLHELPDAPSFEEERTTKHPDCTRSGDGIHGNDDRVAVSNMLAVPYRWICQLAIRQRRSDNVVVRTGATGVLVSPRHVLTVAHAITGSTRDDRNQLITYEAFDIMVAPARDGSDLPFGKVSATWPAHIAPGWNAKGMPAAFDYALLTLEKSIGAETYKRLSAATLCYWGAISCGHPAVAYRVDPTTLRGVTARTAGYPKDRGNAESAHETTGVLSRVVANSRTMQYSADACQGQSGSPVWVTVDTRHTLVGIVSRVGADSTTVVRVTREMSRQLRKWMGGASEAFVEPAPPKAPESPEGEQWSAPAFESDAVREESEGSISGESGGGDGCATCGARDAEQAWNEQSGGASGESDHAYTAESGESFDEAESETDESREVWNESDSGAMTGEYETDELEADASEYGSYETSNGGSVAIRPKEAQPLPARESDENEDFSPEHQTVVRPAVRRLSVMANLPGPLNPGYYSPTGTYTSAATLQTCVTAVGALRLARGVQFALVDLTKGVGSPEFAGVRHTSPIQLASMGKLVAMYAAFQLQDDLRRLSAATAPATLAALITAQQARWTATQSVPPGTPVTAISGHLGRRAEQFTWKGRAIDLPGASVVPDVGTIIGALPALDFTTSILSVVSTRTKCDEYVVLVMREHARNDWADGLRFEQRMKMMIGQSDNRASATCINDIGFAYMNALMVQSGLWHPARGGGLWLAGNYGSRSWSRSPLGGFSANGTTGALVSYMTLLAQGRLVNAAASTKMKELLLKRAYPGAGTRSPVLDGLSALGGAWTVHSKLGLLLNPTRVYDTAIVQRTEGGKALHYAIAITNAQSDAEIEGIARALHSCIRTNNGLPP